MALLSEGKTVEPVYAPVFRKSSCLYAYASTTKNFHLHTPYLLLQKVLLILPKNLFSTFSSLSIVYKTIINCQGKKCDGITQLLYLDGILDVIPIWLWIFLAQVQTCWLKKKTMRKYWQNIA